MSEHKATGRARKVLPCLTGLVGDAIAPDQRGEAMDISRLRVRKERLLLTIDSARLYSTQRVRVSVMSVQVRLLVLQTCFSAAVNVYRMHMTHVKNSRASRCIESKEKGPGMSSGRSVSTDADLDCAMIGPTCNHRLVRVGDIRKGHTWPDVSHSLLYNAWSWPNEPRNPPLA